MAGVTVALRKCTNLANSNANSFSVTCMYRRHTVTLIHVKSECRTVQGLTAVALGADKPLTSLACFLVCKMEILALLSWRCWEGALRGCGWGELSKVIVVSGKILSPKPHRERTRLHEVSRTPSGACALPQTHLPGASVHCQVPSAQNALSPDIRMACFTLSLSLCPIKCHPLKEVHPF